MKNCKNLGRRKGTPMRDFYTVISEAMESSGTHPNVCRGITPPFSTEEEAVRITVEQDSFPSPEDRLTEGIGTVTSIVTMKFLKNIIANEY